MTGLQMLIDNCDQYIAEYKMIIQDNYDGMIKQLAVIMCLTQYISKSLYISIQGNLNKEIIILPLFNKLKELHTQQLDHISQMIHQNMTDEQTYINVSNTEMEKLNSINNLINLYYGTDS